MEYRYLGRTGLELSVLSFGSWVTFAKQIDDYFSEQLMSYAYERGVNFFDNAEVYADGESELMMGRVLRNTNWDRTSYVLSSKVFFGIHGKNNKPTQKGLGRKHVVEACEQALKRLQTDYIDLYFCHRPDPNVPMEEIVRTMNTLIQQGKILYWGTSEWSAAQLLEANEIARSLLLEGPKMEQPQYNLFERQKVEHDYNAIYDTYGLGTTIWSPLASGVLTGKYNNGVPDESRLALDSMQRIKDSNLTEEKIQKVVKLASIAQELNVSLASLAIAWCIKNPHVTTAILGATKLEQLEDNMKALDLYNSLGQDVWAQVEKIFNA